MRDAVKNLMRIAGFFMLAYALILSVRAEWILNNISSSLFYAITCTALLGGAFAGLYWMWRKKDIDTLFFPTTALSLLFGIGLLSFREWTASLVGPDDLLLILVISIAMGGGAFLALGFLTRGDKPH